MQHAVLLGHDSMMRFNNRTYHSLPPQLLDHRIFGELELSDQASAGVRAYAVNPVALGGGFHLVSPVALGGGFHLCNDGAVGVTLSDEPTLLTVKLVRSNCSRALTCLLYTSDAADE